jgi:hypothetical protein
MLTASFASQTSRFIDPTKINSSREVTVTVNALYIYHIYIFYSSLHLPRCFWFQTMYFNNNVFKNIKHNAINEKKKKVRKFERRVEHRPSTTIHYPPVKTYPWRPGMPHGVPKEPSSHQQQLSNSSSNSNDNNEFFFKNQFEMGQGGGSSYTGGMNQPFTPMTSPSPQQQQQQQMKSFGGSSNSSSNLHGSNVAFSTQPPPLQSPSKSRRSSKASNDKSNGSNGVGQNGGGGSSSSSSSSSSFLDVQPETMGSAMSKFSFSGRVPDLSSGFVPVDPYR